MSSNEIGHALCLAITGRAENVNWTMFSARGWEALVAAGHAQGVLPLLAHAFDATGWSEQMPPAVRHQIMAVRYGTMAHAMVLYQELARVVQALTHVSPVVVLKGAALGPTVYPDRGLRPLSDIDLLVPEHALAAAGTALAALGYTKPEVPQLASGNDAVHHHLVFQGGPMQCVTVEVHWRLIGGAADWRSPDHQWFWQHTERYSASVAAGQFVGDDDGRHHVLHLTPTAHLLYLAAHLMLQHGGAQARLIWLYDLHLLVTQRVLDWDVLLKQAQAFRWAAALHGALQAAQQVFDTPLPEHVWRALDAASDGNAAAFVQHKAVAQLWSLKSIWLDLGALRWPTRVWWVLRVSCPSPAYMRWRYRTWPAVRWVWPLCYPYRWLRALTQVLRWMAERHRRSTVPATE